MKRILLVLLVLVGTSSVTAVGSTSDPSALARENATAYPPGLSAQGVADPLALADAHRDALSNVSYTMTSTTTFQRPNGSIRSQSVTTTRVAPGASSFSVVTAQTEWNASRPLGVGSHELATWANETTSVTAHRFSDGEVTYRHGSRDDAPFEPDAQWGLLYSAFDATNTTVVNQFERNETTLFRVVSTAQPVPDSAFAGRSNYSLVAVVDSRGIVRTLQLTYRTTFDGDPAIVSRTMHVSNLGDATVERPSWYDAAVGNESEK